MRARLVHETMQIPFTNNTRNDVIKGSYPLSKIQYEDVDKPDNWNMPMPCKVCGEDVKEGEFVNGVCKKCAEHGFWQDEFGNIHRQNSRVRRIRGS